MDWLAVKLKAGRIIPALATTTACIAGLQTIEVCKIIKGCKYEEMCNSFLNLAIPTFSQSEPGPVPKNKITEDLTCTIWDCWELKVKNDTLRDVFEKLHKKYKLFPRDVFYGSKLIYFDEIMSKPGNEQEKEEVLKTTMMELLDVNG